MDSMYHSLNIATTQQTQFIDVTARVQQIVKESKIREGIVIVLAPHTTAGITINENTDPDVRRDALGHLDTMVPASAEFRHREGNSPAHIKTSLIGSSATVIVAEGHLVLGSWQGIYLGEFDGPRTRTLLVKVMEG